MLSHAKNSNPMNSPKDLNYFFPPEWAKHKATWLTYPHHDHSFPDSLELIYPSYFQFIRHLTAQEAVFLITPDELIPQVQSQAAQFGITHNFYTFPAASNDVWTRDHGPAFLLHRSDNSQAVICWNFNAWGNKYDASLDAQIATKIAQSLSLHAFRPGIVLEGGSIDVNGNGDLLTTTSCLLNTNRNPHLSQSQIEQTLYENYNVTHVHWLKDGIIGDDTDGHIDDITRFVNDDTIVTAVDTNKNSDNYLPLQENLKILKKLRLANGKQPTIVEIPLPKPVIYGSQLPASYCNFYIANAGLILPTFHDDKADTYAYDLLSQLIDRPVLTVDSFFIIRGLGSLHCLSQQQPYA